MLLQTRSAGLPWLGSKDKLDRMIADTSTWLVRNFVPDVGQRGWRRTVDDDKAPDAAITLTVYSALGVLRKPAPASGTPMRHSNFNRDFDAAPTMR